MRRVRGAFAIGVVIATVIAIGCKRGRSGDPGGATDTPPAGPGLSMELAPADDMRSLFVTIRVTGPEAAGVRSLRATRGWADVHPIPAVRDLRVSDAAGPIPVGDPKDEERSSTWPLGRAVTGDRLTIAYTAQAGTEASRLALHRGASGLSGIGHAFVVRPAIDAELPLTVKWLASEAGPTLSLATSLEGRARGTVEDLASAVYLAGVWTREGTPERDEAIVAKGSRIDARAAAEQASRVRDMAAKAFDLRDEVSDPARLFVIGERGIGVEHDGASTGGAIALWLDEGRSFDEGARILVAHEVLHRVFGGAIRLGIEGYEAAWFAEGLATYHARRMLFEQGAIGPEAFLADVERTDGERSAEGHAGDRRAGEYSRGSRYAALLDFAVRRRSQGRRSLDDVVRALAVEARRSKDAPIAIETFRAIVAKEIGEGDEKALWEGLVKNRVPEYPDGVFGPCFRRAVEERKVPELGFDGASLAGRLPVIRGVVPGSAAERAGLRDGAIVVKSSLRAGQEIDPSKAIELVVSAGSGKKRIRYEPVATTRRVVFKPQACARAKG